MEALPVGDLDAASVGLQVDEEQVLSNASVEEIQGSLPQESDSLNNASVEAQSSLTKEPPTKQVKALDNSNTLEAANSLPAP